MIIPSNLRVLVVDDNEYARAIARASLAKLGIQKITEAAGGAEAVALAASQEFDIVLTDWYMPDVNGAGLMTILRDQRFSQKRFAVVVMTAYASRENISRARELEVDELLVKPFSADQLGTCLLQALAGVEAYDAVAESEPEAESEHYLL